MLVQGLDFKTHCTRIFQRHEIGKKKKKKKNSRSCPIFLLISMTFEILRVWSSSQNKQQDEGTFIRKDTRITLLVPNAQN